MRLYPVTGDGTNRITTRDTWLGKYLIPKDTMVWVPFSAAFNSPHNFSRADEYIPVRPYLSKFKLLESVSLAIILALMVVYASKGQCSL